jgi:hypothetical protein
MAAGLGFKEFTTGDVLTAADANGYLASQVVMVFASAAARTSAITSPQEGMISYLKDTNSTEYYSGSAWVAIGGTPPASGLTLITRQSFSNVAGINFTNVFTSTYSSYLILIENMYAATGSDDAIFQFLYSTSTVQSADYYGGSVYNLYNTSTATGAGINGLTGFRMNEYLGVSGDGSGMTVNVSKVGNASELPIVWGNGVSAGNGSTWNFGGYTATSRTYTGFRLLSSSTNISGAAAIYGLAK